jgi:signal transduction histidine kinase
LNSTIFLRERSLSKTINPNQNTERLEWWEWLGQLPQPLRFWLAPKSKDPERRFAEFTLRLLIGYFLVMMFLFRLPNWFGSFDVINTVEILPLPVRYGLEIVVMAVVVWAIYRKNILFAGKVWIALTIWRAFLSLYHLGYWEHDTALTNIWVLVGAFLVLGTARGILLSAATMFVGNTVIAFLINAQGFVPPISSDADPVQFLIANGLVLLLFGIIFAAIRLEFNRRFEIYNKTISTLEERVEERTVQLQEALTEAERASQLKSQFLASMSHELRTPLNAILNFNEMIALGMTGPVSEMQKDLLLKSLNSGNHLLNLINDVLDMSKIQADMLTLFVEDDIRLEVELDSALSTAESLLEHKPDVKLVTDIDSNLPSIRGDRRRIRQVVLNLLSNAIKFTDEGTVTLGAKVKDDVIQIAVFDTGPGIPEDKLEVIFQPFVQTSTGIRHQGGSGLGLAISRNFAELHGGKLWGESEFGNGSKFFFEVPLESALNPTELD